MDLIRDRCRIIDRLSMHGSVDRESGGGGGGGPKTVPIFCVWPPPPPPQV